VIAHVTGRVASRDGDHVVIDVGGIGLELAATRTAERVAVPGSVVTIETYLHVREDALVLFGFGSAGERTLFKLLMGVSGVGPALALAIVSAYAPEQLERAIVAQDIALLSSVPRVGRKTAQKICIDLKDRVGGLAVGLVADENAAAADPSRIPVGADLGDPFYAAREGLVALGYALGDAEAALDGIDGDVDERIRAGLRRLRGPVAR
jgi:Holliday junction DNA helicase RuvA